MALTGHSIIAGRSTPGAAGTFRAVDPATTQEVGPEFTGLTRAEVSVATGAAAAAFAEYREVAPESRARFLEAIADEIEALGEELIDTASLESGLPTARIQGERGRTCGQLRLFADVVRQGDHVRVRIDPALPSRMPLPRPDLRQRQVPLGPVAVFGASNFPLAFSTAGGDTASALAAGCPVVVKAHNAHPGTSELVGWAVTRAAQSTGMPAGVFSLVYGLGNEVGQALVTDPAIQAVGFTGSRAGGLALVAAAGARPQPIPVYAEMSSVNPVVILPGAIEGDSSELAKAYLASLTSGSGQFCTNPGIIFVPNGADGDRFLTSAGRGLGTSAGQTMLTPQIRARFEDGLRRLSQHADVTTVAAGTRGDSENSPAPHIFETSIDQFHSDDTLAEEVFGAAGLVVRYDDVDALLRAVQRVEGQLTATVHAAEADHPAAARLLPVLETRAGRILFNGWPTGVEVSHAMVHGGPYPATSDSRTTSVGTLAIERFQRPVCYQDVPADLLPVSVRDDNPWKLTRRIEGTLTPA